MRKEKNLIRMLRGIVDLLAEESDRNPDFEEKLEALLSDFPIRKPALKKTSHTDNLAAEHLPDIYTEWSNRGESEFRLWLQDQAPNVLRALIRSQDFDPARKTTRWADAEKLAAFISDGLRARLARGSAFIGKSDEELSQNLNLKIVKEE